MPVGELGYAAASVELDAIIGELDQGVVDVDVLDVRFRRAVEIVEELDRRIRGARQRVSALAPRLEAIGAEPADTDRRSGGRGLTRLAPSAAGPPDPSSWYRCRRHADRSRQVGEHVCGLGVTGQHEHHAHPKPAHLVVDGGFQ